MPSPIELDLTLRLPRRRAGRVDLRVTAPGGTTLAGLWPLVEELVGPGVDVGAAAIEASVGGMVLDGSARIGVPPLVHGATVVVGARREPEPAVTAPVDLVVVAGPDAGRRAPVTPAGVVVGRSAGSGLSLADDRLSRRHVVVQPTDEGFRVTDLCSTNGTRVGDVRLDPGGSVDIDGTMLLAIGDSLLRLVRGTGTTAPTRVRDDGRVAVNRSPRTRPPQARVTVDAPTPPTPPHRGRIPWVAAALPLPFAAALAVFFGPQMLAFALLSPLMLVGTVVGDRVGVRREHARAMTRHEAELGRQRAEHTTWRRLEREGRWRDAPDPAAVLAAATGPGPRLWERRRGGAEFARVRLGVGDLPSRTGWAPPTGVVEHAPLADLPVEVALGAVHGLGVVGGRGEVLEVLTHVLGQVAALHSPRDLQLVVIADEEVTDELDHPFSWARWLPHTTAHATAEACLETVRREVTARERVRERGGSVDAPPVLVVLPDSTADVAGGDLVELLERGGALGVWCLAGARTAAALPAACGAVVDLGRGEREGAARLDVDGAEPVPTFTPDRVQGWWGERLGRSLAALVDASGDTDEVPAAVDLLDLLPWIQGRGGPSAAALIARWRQGSGRPVAHLGRTAGGDWVVDLAADGPHLLVGGTTGSGKSELLRSLVTSLALGCSPADLSFVLVDYKGGAAFGKCGALPHTVGLVTNLDEGLSRRALTSLRAEVDRREHLLAASGSRDYDDHRRRAGGLARLVIVVDEFRLLADELPDFVDGVVSLAAVGRSLGIHLVLATQRPAGAVTPDIQANVNLRIAMRVRDVADSTDVIGSPDAARVRADRPGRGFARGGDGVLVEFQAARVGHGGTRSTTTVQVLDATGAPTGAVATTGGRARGLDGDSGTIAAVAAAAHEAMRLTATPPPHRPWLPPLPDSVAVASVGVDGLGLVDLPDEQRQHRLTRHALHGLWLVAGGARSGRTSWLRTVVASHVADPAADVHVYAVDTSGELADLETLPQVGAVVAADDVSRVRRLLEHLRRLDAPAARCARPAVVLLVVDGWDRLDSDGDGDLVVGLRDELLDLLRSGGGRLSAVVTGDRSLLAGRVGAVASETFVLPLADPSDATYAGLSPRDLPSSRAPGRALRLRDRREVQLALRDPVADAVPPTEGAPAPVAIPRLPALVNYRALLDAQRTEDRDPSLLAIGISAETGSVAHLDLGRSRRILVAGHAGSGRSTSLGTIALSACHAGRRVAVVEWRGGIVAAAAPDAVAVDPWEPGALVDARRAHPDLVVLVDDAERLEGTPVDAVLREIGALVDRDGGGIVVATTPTAVATQFRGVVPDVARARTGLLLGPRVPSDGEPFGIRAPRGMAPLPGRGLLVSGSRQVEVQVATTRAGGGRR
ncbi:FtsK/SpoIIIE domain-containing protein [Knoellia sp. CPCC 206435]|uniref:FtsK/SpoIIIE domain-containing protein n=1 Tax=Knoellia terrae TaxID=3404797 RepID=UPI003B4303FE